MNWKHEKTWMVPAPDRERTSQIAAALEAPEIIGQLLLNRGIESVEEAEAFWDPSLARLHDPFLLEDMDAAVQRLKKAIDEREKVLVFGDYDVDGISGTALLVRELTGLGVPVYYYIPNRLVEGYGLNEERIRKAHEECVKLIITVDNGVSSHEEIELAASLGMDTIVCDHHEPEGKLPPALAVLNPKRTGSKYPFRDLSGVGVALKLLTALLGKLPANLDFVALGTIADIVPLVDENRILAKAGLEMINQNANPSPGLLELCKVSALENRRIDSSNVSFQLAPRLNAVGRLGVAQLGVQLLLTTSEALARRIARKLDEENRNRQLIENRILEEALAKIESEFDPKCDFSIVLSDSGWHPGVIGIVASKIVERYHRPAILVAVGETVAKGSARSIHNFHIYEALSKCQEHLIAFGGHRYAAGLTIHPHKLEQCRSAFECICREKLLEDDLRPVLKADTTLHLSEINRQLLNHLARLAPHGNANPLPAFASFDVSAVGAIRLLRGGHLKFAVRQGNATIPAIGFRMAAYEDLVKKHTSLDILYSPQYNTYAGKTTIQLSLRDIRPHLE